MRRMRTLAVRMSGVLCALVALCVPSAAVASPGDVFVSDESAGGGTGAIFRIAPSGGPAIPIASGAPFDEPEGIAWIGQHTLAVADDDASAVFQVDTLTGARSVLASGPPLSSPTGVDRAPDGSIYVTDTGTPDAIYRIDPATHSLSTVHSGDPLSSPREIAVTRQGFAYLAELSTGIVKVDLSNGAISPFAADTPLLSGSNQIALSPDEKTLYVANRVFNAATLTKLDVSTGVPSKLADMNGPGGIAILTSGSLLVTDTTDDTILRFGPTGSPVDTFSSDPAFVFAFDLLVEPSLCGGRFPTVAGTNAPEVLQGTPFVDVIDGRGGADQISGLGGKDVLCGGKGKDRITGGPGNDRLLGQKGKDKLIASGGRRDQCNGGGGRDKAKGCETTRRIP